MIHASRTGMIGSIASMGTPASNPNIEGGCLCRAIRYRIAGVPVSSIVCHCNTCRRASAAPSVAWLTFPFASFALLSDRPQTFQSSPGVKRTFCGSCGTPLTYESDREPGTIDVTTVSPHTAAFFAEIASKYL